MKALVSNIRTKDGKQIPICTYLPKTGHNKVMVMAPTGSLLSDFYAAFARFCQDRGFIVICFDYRGTREHLSNSPRGNEANMHQWAVQDIDAVILHAKKSFPMHEIIHVGHCIGGEIVGLAQASQYINKLVLVNSALSCSKFWKWRDRFRVLGSRTVIRLLNAWYGYFPSRKLGGQANMPKGVMNEWANWCSHANGLFDTYPDNNYRKLQIPILVYSFSDDWHCPPAAVRELLNHFSAAQVDWYHYRPEDLKLPSVGHIGFFIQEKMEKILWQKLVNWVNAESVGIRQSGNA